MILDYKGTSVFYSDQGKGTPIVLLHGFLENSTMWERLIPKLIQTNRVIAIDLLGHGKTGCLGYIHSMELMAEMIHAVLVHLKIDKSIFIGHSMGGYVALAFAEKFPTMILRLCLANSTAKADSPERKINRTRAVKAVKQNHRAFVSMAVTNLFALKNQSLLTDEISHVKKEALKTQQQGIIAALEGMKIRADRTDILKTAIFPKLLIIGRNDTVIPCDDLVKEAEETNTNFVIFPDGHMSYIENEGLFLHEIVHFIE
ncbi:alpha/beta fold hydrolase [Bizionia sp.]|uniref:alpha/beta fold hydrolase n=1 Tax=Bizionia sp. TaxID=1954480 RepID=UPI003A92978D